MSKKMIVVLIAVVLFSSVNTVDANPLDKVRGLHFAVKDKVFTALEKVTGRRGNCPEVTLENAIEPTQKQPELQYSGIFNFTGYTVSTLEVERGTGIEITFSKSIKFDKIKLNSILRRIKHDYEKFELTPPIIDSKNRVTKLFILGIKKVEKPKSKRFDKFDRS